MSQLFPINLLTSFPSKGCPTSFFFILFVSILNFPPIYSSASTPFNSSEYVLREVFQHKDQCYKDSFVYVKEAYTSKSSPFVVYSTTKECSTFLNEQDLSERLPSCPSGLIDLEVTPTYVGKSQISYPYANLNISVTAHSPVSTLVFRLQCLHASDGSDVYCSDMKDMYINGVKEWPCRGIHLSTAVHHPAKFSYACFRLTSYSVYAINATVLPQKCRISTIVTSPHLDEIFPPSLVDPSGSENDIDSTDPYWSPMISVDFSEEQAVWIRLGKAPNAECDTMNVHVYQEHDDNKIKFLAALSVKCPEYSIKWDDQEAGTYLLTAYVPIRGCKFFCEPNSRGCKQCLRTHLNLVIWEDRVSMSWRVVKTFHDYGIQIFIVTALLTLILIILFFVGIYIHYRKQKADANRVRQIQLDTFVKAMIVYTDDNEAHTNCVKLLVDNLKHCANCEPIFDLEKLITIEQVVPSRWLIDQLSTLSKFIIVISHCAEKILHAEDSETHRLVQSRPFADLFEPAMNIIIRDITQNPQEARKKYVIVRFGYSPQVPANLAILQLPTFLLPDEFGRLTAFLHDLEYGSNVNITQNISKRRITEWTDAVEHQKTIFNEQEVMNLQRAVPVVFTYKTNEERIAASQRYNLLPPSAEIEEDEEPETSNNEATYMLAPPPVEDDLEAEEEEEDEVSDTIVAFDS
ncbi:hypothetical protein GCK72_006037 [Caenorhabditis remanei]|uniref:SEFIR domain-containing protein n=1 Tax=Caenorhabditis remanei TaxID=31234 RepID=A0A6A5HGA4_CAERE|nr:hypothetical protein GCK72_006037 [Caenorhabditis remanei]KAF1766081.1 hypothetical protein GCK72_006037 [Caenorhabditis remanei]